jgi:hypothetical protein
VPRRLRHLSKPGTWPGTARGILPSPVAQLLAPCQPGVRACLGTVAVREQPEEMRTLDFRRALSRTYVGIPFGLIAKSKSLSKFRLFISTRERDSFWLRIPIATDFNVIAMGIVLRTAPPDWLRRDVVSVESHKLGAEDV